jgi:hypothetical protein
MVFAASGVVLMLGLWVLLYQAFKQLWQILAANRIDRSEVLRAKPVTA